MGNIIMIIATTRQKREPAGRRTVIYKFQRWSNWRAQRPPRPKDDARDGPTLRWSSTAATNKQLCKRGKLTQKSILVAHCAQVCKCLCTVGQSSSAEAVSRAKRIQARQGAIMRIQPTQKTIATQMWKQKRFLLDSTVGFGPWRLAIWAS